MECIFCKIINGEIKTDFVYEDDSTIVIKDINPKAPIHLLIIPKQHIPTLNDINDEKIMSSLLKTTQRVAKQHGVADEGYRLIINCNEKGGQSVYHVHIHFLAGEQMHGF